MNDSIDFLFSEHLLYRSVIATVDLIERNILLSGNFLYSLEACHVTVRHIVRYHDIITGSDQLYGHMTSDISGTTGNKNFSHKCK